MATKTKSKALVAGFSSDLLTKLAGIAKNQQRAAVGGSGWPFISLKNGIPMLGERKLDNPFQAVILGFVHENGYYKEAYDPKSPSNPPDCTAIGLDPDTLAPHASVAHPENDKCASCWANAWGSSGRKGSRGKACTNRLRLCILPYHKGVKLGEVEGARFRIPPTSTVAFDKYQKALRAFATDSGLPEELPPLPFFVTNIEVVDDPKNQFALKFQPVVGLKPAEADLSAKRVVEAFEGPMMEVNVSSADEKKTSANRKSTRSSGASRLTPNRGRAR